MSQNYSTTQGFTNRSLNYKAGLGIILTPLPEEGAIEISTQYGGGAFAQVGQNLGDLENPQEAPFFYLAGETTNAQLYSGADLIVFSDAGLTEVARIDGTTGNVTTNGTVDTIDVANHAHTAAAGQGVKLDWDTVWTDAVHSHASDAEGSILDADVIAYTPAVATDWDSDTDPGDVDDALDQLAERVDDLEITPPSHGHDAADITYTPLVLTDWDGDADPGDVDNALDQLAERVDDLEGGSGHDAVTLDADAAVFLDLNGQEIGLDTQTANTVFAGPATGEANEPTFRVLVADDIPDISATYEYITENINVKNPTYGAVGDGITDDTTAILAAIATGKTVFFPKGTYKITDELVLNSNQTIILNSGVTIKQYTASKNIFKATGKDNVWIHCDGAVLYGEGTWSDSWTGMSGHEDRAIQFINCTRSGVTFPTIKNCGSAGIAIISGSRIRIVVPSIEGTHQYSTPLASGNNFQAGIYLSDSVANGALDDVIILAPDISGTAQGILFEAQSGAADTDVGIQIIGPNIHDIPGQHAFYVQRGKVAISNPTLSDIALSGVKIQSGDSNKNIKAFSATGVVASDLGSNLFEISTVGSGSVSDVILSGAGQNIDSYGLAVSGGCSRIKCDMVLSDVANPVYIYGASVDDIDVKVIASGVTNDGVLITATTATGIKIRPTLRNCNSGQGANECGIRINSASAVVDIYDPDITDSNGYSQYGLFVVDGSVGIWGHAIFEGALHYGARADANLRHWPEDAVITGSDGRYYYMPTFVAWYPPEEMYSTIPIGSIAFASFGVETVAVAGTFYYCDLYIPRLMRLTGAAALMGATVGTDKIIYGLYDSAGNLVANTALAGVTTTGADTFKEIAFTSTYVAKPGRYWIGIQYNGTTDKFRYIPTTYVFKRTMTETGSFGTMPALDPLPIAFNTEAPIAYVY